MDIEEEMKRTEALQQAMVQRLVSVEMDLERLYFEQAATQKLYEKLQREQIEVQVLEGKEIHEVRLLKGDSFAFCVARSLYSAMLGAIIALRGEADHAL